MRDFQYATVADLSDAMRRGLRTGQGQTDAATQYLAGGTTLVDLMKLEVLRPTAIVNLAPLRATLSDIVLRPDGLHLGALATMAKVADHPGVRREYPVIADSLALAASPQLRNMATLGGNVLQKTRCPFYRDLSFSACNKREPGSGCQAIDSFNRNHAILGVDASCIAQYPGDFGVALITLDAVVELSTPRGVRRMPFSELHRDPEGHPHIETSLRSGEIITGFSIPAAPGNARSLYLKIRDRSSYEFAIASCAVALDLDGDVVKSVRLGLGGMAYRPWRARETEQQLVGKPLNADTARAAAAAAVKTAVTHAHNGFKRELAQRTLVRALLQAKSMSVATEHV
jgi:xanthine dehydrogenase YagS FAD-binding subunit